MYLEYDKNNLYYRSLKVQHFHSIHFKDIKYLYILITAHSGMNQIAKSKAAISHKRMKNNCHFFHFLQVFFHETKCGLSMVYI